jgi:hypothetical protein
MLKNLSMKLFPLRLFGLLLPFCPRCGLCLRPMAATIDLKKFMMEPVLPLFGNIVQY